VNRTPGFIVPSSFPDKETMIKKLHEINKNAGFSLLNEELLHSSLDDILSHHGIKGMHWGVRGGKGTPTAHPQSDDAQRVAESKGKVKSGGTKALSTKELQELVTRLNLEQQFDRLQPSAKKQTTKFIADTLLSIGKQELTKAAAGVAAKQVAGLLKK